MYIYNMYNHIITYSGSWSGSSSGAPTGPARAHGLSQDYLYWDGWVGGVCGRLGVGVGVCVSLCGERQGASRCVRRAPEHQVLQPWAPKSDEEPGAPRRPHKSHSVQNEQSCKFLYWKWYKSIKGNNTKS